MVACKIHRADSSLGEPCCHVAGGRGWLREETWEDQEWSISYLLYYLVMYILLLSGPGVSRVTEVGPSLGLYATFFKKTALDYGYGVRPAGYGHWLFTKPRPRTARFYRGCLYTEDNSMNLKESHFSTRTSRRPACWHLFCIFGRTLNSAKLP